ncbi:MAG: response regulator [Pirellulaceae bacterium]
MKRVLDVGNCGLDHGNISSLIGRHFTADIFSADSADQALALLRKQAFDLVLVNRKLDRDYSDGLDIIRQIKADEALAATPVMLLSNYAQYQDEAIEAGAEPGFGKSQLHQPETVETLRRFLA